MRADTGAPIEFARVLLEGTPRVQRADGDGDFVMSELTQGTWAFRALEDVDGALTDLSVEIETGEGEVLSQTTRVTLEESEFIDPETFDPL